MLEGRNEMVGRFKETAHRVTNKNALLPPSILPFFPLVGCCTCSPHFPVSIPSLSSLASRLLLIQIRLGLPARGSRNQHESRGTFAPDPLACLFPCPVLRSGVQNPNTHHLRIIIKRVTQGRVGDRSCRFAQRGRERLGPHCGVQQLRW